MHQAVGHRGEVHSGRSRAAGHATSNAESRARDGTRRRIRSTGLSTRSQHCVTVDGYWHLVGFAIPESSRKARDALRTRVVYLGGALVQGGLYVSPHTWEPYVLDAAAELDVEQHLSSLTTRDLKVGRLEDPVKIAAQLWPLDEIAVGYERLLDVASVRLEKLQNTPGTDAVTVTIELAAEFTRAMEPDPLLPPELLPTNWIGTRARFVTAQCWALLAQVDGADELPSLFHLYADAIGDQDASVR